LLPGRYQRLFQPLCHQPSGAVLVSIFSLLVGSWTHLMWDSLTHQDGWVVGHVSALQYPLVLLAGRTVRPCHVLWYLSSFVGVVLVFTCYMRWQRAVGACASGASDRADLGFASLVGLLLLPVELVHHLLPGGPGLALAGITTLLLLLAILRWISRKQLMTEDIASYTNK
jgi:hypothetical protein